MQQTRILGFAALAIFLVVITILMKLIPEPRKDSDFLVIGSVATMVTLAAVFVLVISTTRKPGKGSEVFFKRRRKGS
jgi:Na+/melibiose symporter-like transporter